MKKVIKGFIHYLKPYSFEGAEAHGFTFFTGDMSEHGYVMVRPHELEIEVPDNFDPRPLHVAQLEKEKQKARAKFAARITEIERQISELTCLEAS